MNEPSPSGPLVEYTLAQEADLPRIVEIANWNQANAIRQMTIQKGIDPRRFALLSFGGSGPAQSPAVARLLGPSDAGAFFLAVTAATVASTAGRLGLDNTVVRFSASRMALDDRPGARGVARRIPVRRSR